MAPFGLQVASLQFSSQLLPIPIPSPEVLKKYAEIDPNLPKQIVDEALEQVEFTRQLTQKQMQHRHELEKMELESNIRRSGWGLGAGFIVALVALGVSAFAAERGQQWPAAVIGGGTLASLVSTFIYGSKSRREERSERLKQMMTRTETPKEPNAPR